MPQLGAPEILLILVVLVLLFGAKRLPDTARSLGKSMRIFKSETRAMRDEDEDVRHTVTPEPPRSLDAPPPRVAEPRVTETRAADPRPANEPNADR